MHALDALIIVRFLMGNHWCYSTSMSRWLILNSINSSMIDSWFSGIVPPIQARLNHYKDETMGRPSYLYKGYSYRGNTPSLYWNNILILKHPPAYLSAAIWHEARGGHLSHVGIHKRHPSAAICQQTTGCWCRTKSTLKLVLKFHCQLISNV